MASSDRFQYLQQVKHYNCLIKSLESSLRNSTATFGAESEQARFCRDMLQVTLREAAMIGVTSTQDQGDAMEVDEVQPSQEKTDEVMDALKELKERMDSVKIG